MATDILVPTLGESVSEATVAKWFKAAGETVSADEPILELETDKVTLEVNAPIGGTLVEITAAEGAEVAVGALLGRMGDAADAETTPRATASAPKAPPPAPKAPPPAPKMPQAAGDIPSPPLQPPVFKATTAEVVVPSLGESIASGTLAKWLKQAGEAVSADEPLAELETDKVTVEVNAPAAGALAETLVEEGTDVAVGTVIARLRVGAGGSVDPATVETQATPAAEPPPLSPAARKLIAEHRLDPSHITGSGKNGRITKGDVLKVLASPPPASEPTPATPTEASPVPAATPPASAAAPPAPAATEPMPSPEILPVAPDDPREERVRMTRLRKMVAARLKSAQNTAAMLTTYNEVDMSETIALRNRYKEIFEKKHGIRVGFMSLFIKACVTALKEWPAVNGEIRGDDIVYKNYYDIAIAVGSPQGLVVPVIRDADQLSFAEIEKTIKDFGLRARDGKLKVEEMTGGTFTISNGGIYGSLMSSPILNPPQSGILGMHKIQMRPMVMPDGGIEARPMMYLALSYDHRIIDGREAVSFLVRVKECIEDPQRIMLVA